MLVWILPGCTGCFLCYVKIFCHVETILVHPVPVR
uniref:Uncharacterized protein n=1 Tax=Arundo donax TaxID=35708 RepID=A0A0A8ZLP8_ARUDO